MKNRIARAYTAKSYILSNWVVVGDLGDCPNCGLSVIRIIETGASMLYYHSCKVICEVRK